MHSMPSKLDRQTPLFSVKFEINLKMYPSSGGAHTSWHSKHILYVHTMNCRDSSNRNLWTPRSFDRFSLARPQTNSQGTFRGVAFQPRSVKLHSQPLLPWSTQVQLSYSVGAANSTRGAPVLFVAQAHSPYQHQILAELQCGQSTPPSGCKPCASRTVQPSQQVPALPARLAQLSRWTVLCCKIGWTVLVDRHGCHSTCSVCQAVHHPNVTTEPPKAQDIPIWPKKSMVSFNASINMSTSCRVL
jgi:hypothetical protein